MLLARYASYNVFRNFSFTHIIEGRDGNVESLLRMDNKSIIQYSIGKILQIEHVVRWYRKKNRAKVDSYEWIWIEYSIVLLSWFIITLIEPVWYAVVDSARHSGVCKSVVLLFGRRKSKVNVVVGDYHHGRGVSQPSRILQPRTLHLRWIFQPNWHVVTEKNVFELD